MEEPSIEYDAGFVDGLEEGKRQLQAEIANLKAELEKHRWIPVTERLPKGTGIYQVLREINRLPTSREYCAKSLMWLSRENVTHWKPIMLPEDA